jgi:lipopolysaccharide/colanic/teichoic acid biosynthesis glycosyltransferase
VQSLEGSENVGAEKTRKDKGYCPNFFTCFIKRLFDFVTAFLGMIIFLPLFIGIAIAIRKDSPGPIIYTGRRMGRRGRPFNIYKFRTMQVASNDEAGAPITACDDPRVTKIGRFLRDTKLNELPQLWNVLIGDMSFVGPRPEDYDIAMTWDEDVKEEILSVRPGITSPASILYRDEEKLLKGDGFLDDYLVKILPVKLRLDQLYVRNHNILTDIDIIAMTAIAILPSLRQKNIDERYIFGGPIFALFRRIVPWFLLDIIVAAVAVGLSGVAWRISTVINLGVWTFIVLALVIAILTSFFNMILGLQRISWDNASPAYILDIGVSVGLTMAMMWAVNRFWITEPWIPFSMFWLIGLTVYIGLLGVRYRERLLSSIAYRWLLFRGDSPIFTERILIVGAGRLGELATWLVKRSAYESVFGLVGFVDDDFKKRDMHYAGVRVLGPIDAIPALVKKYQVDVLMIAIENCRSDQYDRILEICNSTEAKVVKLPDLVKVLEKSLQGLSENVK